VTRGPSIFLDEWRKNTFGAKDQDEEENDPTISKTKPRLTITMEQAAYKSVMKDIFHECCDKNGDISKDLFKSWIIACSRANNQSKTSVNKLIARNDIFFTDMFHLIDTSRDGLLQWTEIWNEIKEGKDKLQR